MSTFPLTTKEMEEVFEHCYDDAQSASGQCWRVTELLVESFEVFEWIGADHANDPNGRFDKLGQYGNHFAAYHQNSDLIVDYTFRQFDDSAPYPLICPKEEWIERLAYVWETDCVRFVVGYNSLDCCEDDFSYPEDYGDFLDALEFWDCEAAA